MTPWTVGHQDPLYMGFSWQRYWSGSPFPSPGDLPDPGIRQGLWHCRQTLSSLSPREALNLSLIIFSLAYLLSHVGVFATPWPMGHQVPLSMGFSRQEYWSGLLFPSPGDLPNPGIEPGSPTLQADALPSESPGKLLQWEGASNTQLCMENSHVTVGSS